MIENGREIAVGITDDPTIGVDTPEDARRFEEAVRRGGAGLRAGRRAQTFPALRDSTIR